MANQPYYYHIIWHIIDLLLDLDIINIFNWVVDNLVANIIINLVANIIMDKFIIINLVAYNNLIMDFILN